MSEVIPQLATFLAEKILKQPKRKIAADEALLETVPALLPAGVPVVFLADRGFADTELLAQRRRRRHQQSRTLRA